MIETEEIINEFLDECDELLESGIKDVLDLEASPDDEILNRIFRAFHSVKGNARMVGFDRLGALAHKAEDLLSLIRNKDIRVDKSTIDLLLHAMDLMRLIILDIRQGGDDSRDMDAVMHFLTDTATEAFEPQRVKAPDRTPEPDPQDVSALTGLEAAPVSIKTTGGVIFDLGEKPVKVSVPDKAQQTVSRPAPEKLAARSLKNMPLKILIVEDDFTSRNILSSFLSGYGECHLAKDGLEAIQAFTESYELSPPQPYDLICMDIMMPKMNGMQASRTIREIERGKGVEGTENETAIVMTSAVEDPATIVKACYECGANYYFVKPIDFNQIKRQMRKLQLIA